VFVGVEQRSRNNSTSLYGKTMNQFRQVFSRVASSIPKGGPSVQPPKGSGVALGMLATLGLGSYGLYHSMVTIQPGHAGIIYNRIGGLDDKIQLTEGLNFVLPWFQRVIVFDIRSRPQPIDTQSGSKGEQQSCFVSNLVCRNFTDHFSLF
jgi:hypothetical protein